MEMFVVQNGDFPNRVESFRRAVCGTCLAPFPPVAGRSRVDSASVREVHEEVGSLAPPLTSSASLRCEPAEPPQVGRPRGGLWYYSAGL
jgi:hypothetical protein